MVRLGRFEDRHAAVAMMRRFHAASGLPLAFGPAHAEAAFKAGLADGGHLSLVHESSSRVSGLLLAKVDDFEFGPDRIAIERLWWIDPEARGHAGPLMLEAFEAWARDRGCAFVGMVSLHGSAADKLYRRRGYVAAEQHFLKAI